MPAFMQNIGTSEIIVIGFILILFFGAKKMTEFGKNAGEATKEIKKIKEEITSPLQDEGHDESSGGEVESK